MPQPAANTRSILLKCQSPVASFCWRRIRTAGQHGGGPGHPLQDLAVVLSCFATTSCSCSPQTVKECSERQSDWAFALLGGCSCCTTAEAAAKTLHKQHFPLLNGHVSGPCGVNDSIGAWPLSFCSQAELSGPLLLNCSDSLAVGHAAACLVCFVHAKWLMSAALQSVNGMPQPLMFASSPTANSNSLASTRTAHATCQCSPQTASTPGDHANWWMAHQCSIADQQAATCCLHNKHTCLDWVVCCAALQTQTASMCCCWTAPLPSTTPCRHTQLHRQAMRVLGTTLGGAVNSTKPQQQSCPLGSGMLITKILLLCKTKPLPASHEHVMDAPVHGQQLQYTALDCSGLSLNTSHAA